MVNRAGLLGLFVILAGLCGVSAQQTGWPYFDASVPADEAVFTIVPGVPFTALQNLIAHDPDENSTEAGTIVISQSDARGQFRPVTITRGVFVGATPGMTPVCPTPMPPNAAADVVQKCRYQCPETPEPSSPTASERCARWPSNMVNAGPSSFTFDYATKAGTNLKMSNSTVFSFNLPAVGSDFSFSSPYRRVCVSLASMDKLVTYYTTENILPPAGVTRCWNLLFGGAPFIASCDLDTTRERMPCEYDLFPSLANPVVKVAVGSPMVARVYFDRVSPLDLVDIAVMSDPGLPNGASLGPVRNTTQISSTPAGVTKFLFSREITFTPSARDAIALNPDSNEGLSFTICFKGISGPYVSSPQCSSIVVVRPEPQQSLSITCPSCPTPLPAAEFTAMVRCTYTWNLVLWEAKDFDAATDVVEMRQPFPSGDQVGYEHGRYVPVVTADPMNPMPSGAALSAGMSHQHCRDVTPVGDPFVTFCNAGLIRNARTQEITWTPTRGMESGVYNVCFRLGTMDMAGGMLDETVMPQRVTCSKVTVAKCKVCTKPGDTLESIAKDYRTDWLQLWGANVMVENPRNLAGYGMVTLGRTYVVSKETEQAQIVAGTYGMSLSHMAEVNPDLAAKGVTLLPKDTAVCVIPPVCKGGQGSTMAV